MKGKSGRGSGGNSKSLNSEPNRPTKLPNIHDRHCQIRSNLQFRKIMFAKRIKMEKTKLAFTRQFLFFPNSSSNLSLSGWGKN